MKSVKIFRSLALILMLSISACFVTALAQHNGKAAIESAAALLVAAPFVKTDVLPSSTYRSRKAISAATLVRRPGSQEILKADPLMPIAENATPAEAVASRGNVKMAVYDVLPESTLGGLLEFTITADGTHIATRAIPFIPNKVSDVLPIL